MLRACLTAQWGGGGGGGGVTEALSPIALVMGGRVGPAGQVGLLTANTETFVDDGPFNQLQRTCTFVRDIAPRGAGRPALAAAPAAAAQVHRRAGSARARARGGE